MRDRKLAADGEGLSITFARRERVAPMSEPGPRLIAAEIPLRQAPDAATALGMVAAHQGRAEGAVGWLDTTWYHSELGVGSLLGVSPVETICAGTPQDAVRGLKDVAAALARLRGPGPCAAWRDARLVLGAQAAGGAIGFLGYDAGRALERIRPPRRGAAATIASSLPVLHFTVYRHTLLAEPDSRPGGSPGRLLLAGTKEGFSAARGLVDAALRDPTAWGHALACASEAPAVRRGATRSLTDEEYRATVAEARELIRAGDIFEVNLSQRITAEVRGGYPPLAAYLRLRRACPAPFSAFLRGPGWAVLSASPERFLRVEGRALEARPIKGTRPRGADAASDLRLAAELCASEKDRAELAMIVDLCRNDLGRVAAPGSVRVVCPDALVSFPAVHHLVGHITASLATGRTGLDALCAAFPCGSITGAPKPRAMEVIDQLEPVRRSIYTGAIGIWEPGGDLDLSVAIRTVAWERDRAWFGIGGAVTIDSDPREELEETRWKGRALADALGIEL